MGQPNLSLRCAANQDAFCLLWRGGKNKRQCIDGRHFLRVHLPSSEYPSSVLEYAQTAVVYGVHKVFVVVTSARVERQIRAIVFCGMERRLLLDLRTFLQSLGLSP